MVRRDRLYATFTNCICLRRTGCDKPEFQPQNRNL